MMTTYWSKHVEWRTGQIIIIIIVIITFMQGIYNYIPETNRVSSVYRV
jgi:hypothetical protein